MVKYNCDRCGYNTKYKGNFRSHLYRKATCPPIVSNIDIEIVRKKYGMGRNSQQNGGTPINPHFTPILPPFCESSEFSGTPKKPPFYPHFSLTLPPFLPPQNPQKQLEFTSFGCTEFSEDAKFSGSEKTVHNFGGVSDLGFSEFSGPFFDDEKVSKNVKKMTKNDEIIVSKNVKKMNVNLQICDAEDDSKLRCKYCNKKFSRVKNRYRHQKHYCKVRRELQKYEDDGVVSTTKSKNLEAEIAALKREIRDMKATPSITVEKQQNIGRQQNIIINNYRSENVEYITERVVETLLKKGPYASIPRLMERIHFNSKHPENHNLAITNIKSKFAHVRTNNTWQVKFLNELLEELVTTKFNIIDDYYESGGLKERLHEWKARGYEAYRDELMDKNSELRDKIKLKLFESIINFTKVLGLTHKGAK